jgi:hypothetical protein
MATTAETAARELKPAFFWVVVRVKIPHATKTVFHGPFASRDNAERFAASIICRDDVCANQPVSIQSSPDFMGAR